MAFELIPGSEPLEILGGQTGSVFNVFVPVETEEMSLRVIALWRDNESLGGEPPTFQLRGGGGVFTAVTAGAEAVEIPASDGGVAARASCQRLPADLYLISLTDIAEESRPWSLRIRNNDPETLRFVCVSSHRERDTLQPWMVLSAPLEESDDDGLPTLVNGTVMQITVRNWGTTALVINDEPGSPLGGGQSPVVLVSRPAEILPHHVDHIVARCDGNVHIRLPFEHAFLTNDIRDSHVTFRFDVVPRHSGGGFVPPPPDSFCRRCGSRCPEYLEPPPPAPPGGRCLRQICRHMAGVHFEVPPDHRNR